MSILSSTVVPEKGMSFDDLITTYNQRAKLVHEIELALKSLYAESTSDEIAYKSMLDRLANDHENCWTMIQHIHEVKANPI